MRHGKKINHLGRTQAHRQAMLSNMATSLIIHKRITTTVAKAKALKKYVEPLLTKSKTDSTHSRRVVFGYLQDKNAVTELFREISQKIADRPGGYTRILRTGFRIGDGAEMCIIELVDYNEAYSQNKGGKKAAKKSTRRSGRGKKKETVEAIHIDETVSAIEEIPNIEGEETVEAVAPVVEEQPQAEAKTETEETPVAEEEVIHVDETVSAMEEIPNVETHEEAPKTEESSEAEEEEK